MTDQRDDYSTVPSGAPMRTANIVQRVPVVVPPGVARYLMQSELSQRPVVFHQHWAMITRHAGLAVAALAGAIALNGYLYEIGQDTWPVVRVIWALFTVIALWAALRIAQWRASWIVVSPQRVMTIHGIVMRRVRQLPMQRIRDIGLDQPLWGRLLGYGTLYDASIATDNALGMIPYVPSADRVWLQITSMIVRRLDVPGMPDIT
jgi:membrane protein YdbS with pleckstrin-like domain